MKIDLSEGILIHKFQRRRLAAGIAMLFAVIAAASLAVPIQLLLQGVPFKRPLMLMMGQSVGAAALGVIGALLIYYCPNCRKRPWLHDGFSINPKRCGACKIKLRSKPAER